ncbi:MAG: hypothetical protein ABIH35_02430 [Patescibacteria group bacterium]
MRKKKKQNAGFSLRLSPYFWERLITAIAVVMIWRGLWNLLDAYFFVENPFWSNVFSILIGLLILYLPDGNIKKLV